MEFSNESVVFFKPQNKAINLLVAERNAPLMAYFSVQEITVLKDYFKIIIAKEKIVEFVRKVEAYMQCFSDDMAVLLEFLLYAKDQNKDVICSVPIINFEREVVENNIICFGNFITINKSEMTTQNLDKYFPVTVKAIFSEGKEVESPCSICKLNSQKIANICMYKTSTYECLFNCEISTKSINITPEHEYNTPDLKILGDFWNTKEGEQYNGF